ncbi:tetratricopeptide repeat protein [Photobacterium sp. CCB-ST2H9]|uniref:heme biosynthesis HemY N-terminal domain-containing protein n=1 Tax=unclassified Photobacterium TaxID=2628852 RepID=UPI0020043E76|nr:heme biosynthesis HemY N-terminal domain-containing protein [Photobacterium sp. CCB-ST2H9]UTM57252.1 tetratricopeptide repeat protein [Photobacterium sp. CCB-ST2H9]
MIKLLLLVVALIAGLIFGPMLAGNQGYVLISAANQTLEMSLTTLILLVVVLFGLFFLLENLVKWLLSLSSVTRGWFSGRQSRKARQLTSSGLVKVLEGDWKQAEKLVVKSASHSDTPLLNYLAAAEAAQGQGQLHQRDEYLRQASELDSESLAVALTRARLQCRQHQYEEAVATLQDMKSAHPRNPLLLELLKQCYLELEDWPALLGLIQPLKKYSTLSDEQADKLQEKAECGLMAQIAQHSGSDGLMGHWNSLNRKARQNPVLVACFVREMCARNADSEAYTVLREALRKKIEPQLISLMPTLKLTDYHPAIVTLQDLLRYDSGNATTHSALGQLYLREGKYPEARTHLEKAIELHPTVVDYSYLVETLEKLNDKAAAHRLSREGLALALPSKI